MALFDRQIKFLNDVERDLFPVLQQTINTDRDVIEDFVTEDQLFERGVDGDNKKLRGYARTTIRIKNRKGQPTDRTTLRDTRRFHNSLFVEGFPLAFEVSSDVEYTKYLTTMGNRYGINILKPSIQNMTIFFDDFYIPNLKQDVNSKFAK